MSFGQAVALNATTVPVYAGEVLGLVGPSGSGKSTLLHCLSGLLAPRSGSVYFEGNQLTGLGDEELSAIRCRHFGFVFQFAELVPELTLIENVALPLRFLGSRRNEAEGRATGLLDELGLRDLGERRPSEVSGGQMQRAAIARAIVHKPDVVFADEPTGALDSDTGKDVLDLMLRTVRSRGASLVLVTHDQRVVDDVDRVVTVRDGKAFA